MEQRKPGRPQVWKPRYKVKPAIDLREVRSLKNLGMTNSEIAQKVGCSTSKIWGILNK